MGLMEQSLPSRLKGRSNLWIGVLLVLRLESIINLLLLYLEEILPKFKEQSVCSPTLLLSQRLGLDLFIGTLVRVWKKANFPKPGKIWLPWKKITKKSVWIPVMVMRKMKTKSIEIFKLKPYILSILIFLRILFKRQ